MNADGTVDRLDIAVLLSVFGNQLPATPDVEGFDGAGQAAFAEAARLVSRGGILAALIHLKDGAIHEECADNLAVARTLRESRLMPLARNAFAAGFDLIAGRIKEAQYQEADKEFAPAVEAVKDILRQKGPHAAGGLVANLFKDLGYMYSRMQNYVPDEVFNWIDGMTDELVSYEGRMGSMTRSAVDEAAIRAIADTISAMGFEVDDPQVLPLAESGKPAAWIFQARRED